MRIQKTFRRSLPAILLLGSIGPSSAAVGRFAVVQNEVMSQKPGAAAIPAVFGAAIDLEEIETTGPSSAAKMAFGEGAVISLGQKTTFKVTRQEVDQATGASSSTLDLLLGKARIFVSRFWSGRPEVKVETPTAVVGIKGSEVVVEVFDDGSTVVTVITGKAWVRAKGQPGVERNLDVAEQLRVGVGGFDEKGPAKVAPATLVALRAQTEPDPWAPRVLPQKKPTQMPPSTGTAAGGVSPGKAKSRFVASTSSTSSHGVLWSDPATGVAPDVPSGRGQGQTRGQ